MVNTIMRYTFILPNAAEARINQTITIMKQLGLDIEVYAFDRQYYQVNPGKHSHISLGRVERERYFKRIIPIVKAVFTVRSALRNTEIVHAVNLDMMLLVCLSTCFSVRKPLVVLDIADIRNVLVGPSIRARLLRFAERKLMKRVDLLLVTSQAFITEYFGKIQRISEVPYMVIENKVYRNNTLSSLSPSRSAETSGTLRIGYFGLLRCKRSWETLKTIVERGKENISVYVRGFPFAKLTMANIERDVAETKGIEYGGPFISPDDLPSMYRDVDLLWACYPYEGRKTGNWMWARTIRFYQACYYKKPMIVQAGTEDARVVREMELGLAVDLSNVENAAESVISISDDMLRKWKNNMEALPEEFYCYTNEHQRMLDKLSCLIQETIKER